MLFACLIGLNLRSIQGWSAPAKATERESAWFRARRVAEIRLRAYPSQPHMRAGLMPLDPVAFEIPGGTAGIAKERPIDWTRCRQRSLACRGFRISERVACTELHPASLGPEKIDAGGVVRGIGSGRSIGRGDRAKFPPFTS